MRLKQFTWMWYPVYPGCNEWHEDALLWVITVPSVLFVVEGLFREQVMMCFPDGEK